MQFLKPLPLFCSLLLAVTASAQKPASQEKEKGKPSPAAAPKLKPLAELLSPAQTIVGLWHSKTPAGDEYMTFAADGRVMMKRGASESMDFKYTLDTSTQPWKMDMSGVMKGVDVTIFTVFDFPAPDQFRMGRPSPDKEKRPDAKALAESRLVMDRVNLAANEGVHQVVEALLKKLAGTWQGKDGSETVTLTFTAAGDYTMKVADFTDKGRFSVNVTKVPVAIDLLSSEGAGVKYSIVGFTDDGQLRVGTATANAAERQTAFDDSTAKTYQKKETTPGKAK